MTAECGPTETPPTDIDIDAMREKYRVEREKATTSGRFRAISGA